MNLPLPEIGQVLRYSFLWSHEAERGHEDGAKDRPAGVVLSKATQEGDCIVWVVPITHEPPKGDVAIEIPPAVCEQLGLDDERQWLVANELNRFAWPGYDIRPIPGRGRTYVYGRLPKSLFEDLRATVLRLLAARKLTITGRDSD